MTVSLTKTPVVSPRLVYIAAVLVVFLMAIADHLTSPALSNLAAPTELGNACAPCGAPCPDPQSAN